MEVTVAPDAGAVAVVVADELERALRARDTPVLGLATGASPLGAYEELVRRHREDGLSFARAQAFLLDEYVGLPPGDSRSFLAFARRHLTDHVDLLTRALAAPDVVANDLDAACDAYEAAIAAAGGIDLQLLGIGSNGHLGFNEPGSPLTSRCRVVALAEQTRRDNGLLGDDGRPPVSEAVTLGVGTILEARRLVLVATGAHKATIVARALDSPVDPDCPASAIQHHPSVRVVLDAAAASALSAHRRAPGRG